MKFRSLLLLIVSVSILNASSITVKNAYVRATPSNYINSAAFMEVYNSSNKDISIISAFSDASKVAKLYTYDMKNGTIKMHQVPKISIKANSFTILKPGGFNIMLSELKIKPLKEQMNVEINLHFSNGQIIKVFAPVKKVIPEIKIAYDMDKKSSGISCITSKCISK